MNVLTKSSKDMLTKLGFKRNVRGKLSHTNQLYRRRQFETLESRQLLAITVNTPVDERDFSILDGDVSLRDAVQLAPDGETINFAASLNGATIALLQGTNLGEIAFGKNLTIDASMLDSLTIDASGADPTPTQNNFDGIRIFNITDPTSGSDTPLVTLKGLTLKGGDANGFGGAISSTASLEIANCMITDNHARQGGAIDAFLFRNSTITITNSVISGNSTISEGGAIYWQSQKDTSVSIIDSQITDNSANNGGGVFGTMGEGPISVHRDATGSSFTMQRTRVDGNTATNRGGGLFTSTGSGGTVTIEESVITGNSAGEGLQGGAATLPNSGGGVYAYLFSDQSAPRVTIAASEISENMAGQSGGGLQVCTKREAETSAISEVSVYNTTISGNTAGPTNPPYDPSQGGGAHLAIFDAYGQPEEALDARFQNVTITNNKADEGGGVSSVVADSTDTHLRVNDVRLTNSLVSANRKHNLSPNNLHGSFNITQTVFNLIGSGSTIFDHLTHNPASLSAQNILNNDNPQLDSLAWNGGPTRTHRPVAASAAVDAGSNALAVMPFTTTPPLATDQRGEGFGRPYNVPGVRDPDAIVDIGAYEVGLAKVIDVRLSGMMPNGQPWVREPYSFAELVPQGMQHAPIFTSGVNKIQLEFSELVTMPSNPASTLSILGACDQPITFATTSWGGYDGASSVATWTLSSPLVAGKYALRLQLGITGLGGTALDGDWTNFDGPGPIMNGNVSTHTPDIFDDDLGQPLRSGNGVAGGTFQFHFAYLPGDYNQDGKVRSSTGPSGEASDLSSLRDGNGDGAINSTDQSTVTNAISAGQVVLPASKYLGDYIDDDNVDGDIAPNMIHLMDYMKWKATFGSTQDLAADGNDNGVVDSADYTLWRGNAPYKSAWYCGPLGSGAALPIVDFGNAPKVANVTISGSASIHAPYSFDAHDGSGEQLRTVPVGGADTISITFSEDVNVGASHLRLVGLYSANVPTFAEFSYDMGTMTASWRFVGWTFGDQYALRLDDAITDVEGNRLDGEWVNPHSLTTTNAAVSEFPSGDGSAGGDFQFIATLLPGDANLDLQVTSADLAILSSHYNNGQIDELFSEGDFNGDGVVDFDDVVLYSPNSGANLQQVWLLADLNSDFAVDDLDAAIMAANMGMSDPTWADGDLDDDNAITLADLDLMYAQYGLDLAVVS